MEPVQVLIYILIPAFVAVSVRRVILRRSVEQVDPRSIPAGAVLLDVRTAAERSHDSIPGSIHIPLPELSSRAGELERYRGSRIVCYCASGNRSLTAAARLGKLGFTAASLSGGITMWRLAAARR
jgi:rhodanese-related sulfurtransferase